MSLLHSGIYGKDDIVNSHSHKHVAHDISETKYHSIPRGPEGRENGPLTTDPRHDFFVWELPLLVLAPVDEFPESVARECLGSGGGSVFVRRCV